MDAYSDLLLVRSDLTIKVLIEDPLLRPIVNRYLDHLVSNLRNALRGIDWGQISNIDPQVIMPLQVIISVFVIVLC